MIDNSYYDSIDIIEGLFNYYLIIMEIILPRI